MPARRLARAIRNQPHLPPLPRKRGASPGLRRWMPDAETLVPDRGTGNEFCCRMTHFGRYCVLATTPDHAHVPRKGWNQGFGAEIWAAQRSIWTDRRSRPWHGLRGVSAVMIQSSHHCLDHGHHESCHRIQDHPMCLVSHLGPISEVGARNRHVRFPPDSDRTADMADGPVRANMRLMRRSITKQASTLLEKFGPRLPTNATRHTNGNRRGLPFLTGWLRDQIYVERCQDVHNVVKRSSPVSGKCSV